MFLLRQKAGIAFRPVGAGTSVTPGNPACLDGFHRMGQTCVKNTGPVVNGVATLGPNDIVNVNPGIFPGDPCTMKNGCAGGLSQDLVTCIQIDPKCGTKPAVSTGSGLLIGAGIGIAAIALFALASSGHAAPKKVRHV